MTTIALGMEDAGTEVGIAVSEVDFAAGDDTPLGGTLFEPRGAPAAAVLVNSAFGVRRRYYRAFAAFLAERGAAVLSYDYRGVAGSRPRQLRGYAARMTDWGALDTEAALGLLAARFPALPRLVVGHSAGGQILGLAPAAAGVARVLLVAAQSGWHGHWTGWGRFRMAVLWNLLIPPVAETFGYLPGFLGVGEDVPKGVAREWAWWCRHPDYLLRDGGEPRRAAYAALRFPILAVSIADDDYAPSAAVDGLLAIYAGAPSQHRRLAPRDFGRARLGHFGFFRPEEGGALWPDLADWLLTGR